MKATLGDILGGEVEIPDDVQHYQVKDGESIIYRGYGEQGAGVDVDRLMREKVSGLWLHFWDSWPASCEWVVEREESKKGASK